MSVERKPFKLTCPCGCETLVYRVNGLELLISVVAAVFLWFALPSPYHLVAILVLFGNSRSHYCANCKKKVQGSRKSWWVPNKPGI